MQRVPFGHTGLMVSRLSMGTGTHGWGGRSQQTELGFENLVRLLRTAYEWGVNFWDSADQYGSHPHVREALKGLPREEVVITTKTVARSAQEARRDLERFRRELGTEVLDIVLLHCMTEARWSQRYRGAMEVLQRAKEEGWVRAVGVSCHDLGALRTAAEEPWVDVILARINFAGVNMDASPEKVLPLIAQAAANGKAVYGMKVLGCGHLSQEPLRALRFALEVPGILAVTVGIRSERELRQNLEAVEAWERSLAA